MTKEIWAAVIIAIIQIIAMVLVTKWQITSAKALVATVQKEVKPKINLFCRTLTYLDNIPLHILIPLLFNIILTYYINYKYGKTKILIYYIIFYIFILFQQVIIHVVMSYIKNLASDISESFKFIKELLDFQKHNLKRFKCHESILFDLTDKPCKDGVCKFE